MPQLTRVVVVAVVAGAVAVLVAGALGIANGEPARTTVATAPARAIDARDAGDVDDDRPPSVVAAASLPRGDAASDVDAYRALKRGFSRRVHECVANSPACKRAALGWNRALTVLRGPGATERERLDAEARARR